jgi:uncharacterized membrane protein (DUF2068 family)
VRANGSAVLPWIVAFKAAKSLVLACLGVVFLMVRRTDPVDLLVRTALAVHLPVTSVLFERLLKIVLNLTVRKEVALAITAFAYSALMGTEGVSLYLRKSWAPWFTIIATSSLIPLELYEIVRELHVGRVVVLGLNMAIVVWLWRRKEMFESPDADVPIGAILKR